MGVNPKHFQKWLERHGKTEKDLNLYRRAQGISMEDNQQRYKEYLEEIGRG